jgi:rhodanese-related sulfurtransferase/DNA-binding transcriptional ArsR family regulator
MGTQKTAARQHKEHLYELFAQISGALANPHRLELIDLLIQASHTVEGLAGLAQMSVANTSQHLQCLKRARLVICQREGQSIIYSLADPMIARLWIELRRVAQNQLAEVDQVMDQYRSHRHDFEKISSSEVREGLQNEQILLIDARPEDEYQAGHLPGAISLPVDTISRRINQLPMGKTVVTYCRGPVCVDADEASLLLAAYGYPVKRLEDGVAEWQQSGFQLEK